MWSRFDSDVVIDLTTDKEEKGNLCRGPVIYPLYLSGLYWSIVNNKREGKGEPFNNISGTRTSVLFSEPRSIKCVTNKGQVKTAITGPAKHRLLSDPLHLRARLQKLWSVVVVFVWAPPSLSLRPPFICYFNYDDPFSSLAFETEWLFQMIPHMKMDNAKNEE